MTEASTEYPASLSVDYPDRGLNKLTTFFRPLAAIPIWIVLALLVGSTFAWEEDPWTFQGYVMGGFIFLPIVLMIVFRQKYPRWWFDWNLAIARFLTRFASRIQMPRRVLIAGCHWLSGSWQFPTISFCGSSASLLWWW